MPRLVVLTDPLTAQEHNDLGVAYELAGKFELALKAYEQAYRKDKNWDQPLINHGNVHAARKAWRRAELSYREALERNPANPEGMNNLAYVLLQQGKHENALFWSTKAVGLRPDNPVFLDTHASVLKKTGNRDKTGKMD